MCRRELIEQKEGKDEEFGIKRLAKGVRPGLFEETKEDEVRFWGEFLG